MYDDPENESKSKKVKNGVHLKIIILKKFVRPSFIEIVMLLCFVKIFAQVDRAHRVTSRNDLFQDFRTLFFLCCSYLEIFFPYFLYFQHTNRKLLTWRTNKLLIVKHQLDRLGWHMTPKNQTFLISGTFSIPIESSRRGEQISCLSSSTNSIG